MSKKTKTLCKWDKDDLYRNMDQFVKLVRKPRFVCEKCIRTARDKKFLCKPIPIPDKPKKN